MSDPSDAPPLALPIALLTCPTSLTLLVLAGLTRQLPAGSLDEAWDALPDPAAYRPAPALEDWLRTHWSQLMRPDKPDESSQNVAPHGRAREGTGPDTPDEMAQTSHPHARTREETGTDTPDEMIQRMQPPARAGEQAGPDAPDATRQFRHPHARAGGKDEESTAGRPPGASTHGRDWKPRFLEALAAHPLGSATAASSAAGIHRSVAYDARRQDPAFAAAWEKIVHPPYEPLPRSTRHPRRNFTPVDTSHTQA